MNQIKNTDLITLLEKQVESQLAKVIKIIQNLPEDQLLHRPTQESWSIVECFSHLNSYGEYYLPQIDKLIQKRKISSASQIANQENKTFKSSKLGHYFITQIDPKTGSKKLKARQIHWPDTKGESSSTVIAQHIEQQEKLLSLLQQVREINLKKNKIPISIMKMIKLNLGDTLQFLVYHIERHLKQVFNQVEDIR